MFKNENCDSQVTAESVDVRRQNSPKTNLNSKKQHFLSNISQGKVKKKSRTRGYNPPVPVKGTGCDEMNIL